ncbi:hypothetical protein KIW84_011606 [Lathyrus oleraceus]|uniref:ATP-dependent DNA ligase family profile domain-containing protein n=1 Tax=Pisum sativum TaxID=3888 RepID=A0A9D5BFE5_PEA|nr:hypothetical protein KIW84_011606 [Pisum sativum]
MLALVLIFKSCLLYLESGKNSQEKRKNHIKALLFAATGHEPVCLCWQKALLQPMLAKPINCVSDALTKFKDIEITCEYKYDGERAQIHYMENGSVEIYSRNSKRTTGEFPDVVAAVSRN